MKPTWTGGWANAAFDAQVDSGLADRSLAGARQRGQWDNTKALLALGRDKIIDEVKASGLRGLGGAGFPPGKKWQFVRSYAGPRLMSINGDEGEPSDLWHAKALLVAEEAPEDDDDRTE